MDQQQSTQSNNRGGSSFGRFLGIVLTFGLIVSFPVFSYLTPEIRYLLIPTSPSVQEIDPQSVSDGPAGAGFYRREAVNRSGSSGDRRSLTGSSARAFDSTRSTSSVRPSPLRQRAQSGTRTGAGGPGAASSTAGPAQDAGGAGTGSALPSGAAQAFERMDREFNQAADFVFPGVGAGIHSSANPFRRALDGGSPGGDSPQGETPDPTESSDPPPPSPNPPSGDEGPSPGGNDPAPQTPGEGEQDPRWSFLVVGALNAEDQLQVSRGSRNSDGRLSLEDGTSVAVLSSVVGIPSRIQVFAEREMAVSADFNGDGVKDLVIARRNA
ncbi:MAG TPA: hypothetical protein VMN76_04425, partial [Acidobacteriota bacterium]|nr:hypothetical protein [Acidobacteriota bacterium]